MQEPFFGTGIIFLIFNHYALFCDVTDGINFLTLINKFQI